MQPIVKPRGIFRGHEAGRRSTADPHVDAGATACWVKSATPLSWAAIVNPAFCLRLAAAFTAVAALTGCGSRVVRYPVEGLVTLDGKPVKGASIAFMPRGKGQPGVATTDDAGRFAVNEVRARDGIRPGGYQVAVFLAESSIEDASRIERYIVPERYGVAATSGLAVEIEGPTTGLTFPLTTKR